MFEELLSQGERKEVARASEVAAILTETPALIPHLLDFLIKGDETQRAHGAHALMQIGTTSPKLLRPYLDVLFEHLAPIEQWEMREQLLKILPQLDASDRTINFARLNLSHKSAIVRTCALQALFDCTRENENLKSEVKDLLEDSIKTGAKSMQARARKLLSFL